MKITPQQVKDWLLATGRTRAWLGKQLGKSKATINNWLSTKTGIPSSGQMLIRQLMAADIAADQHPAAGPHARGAPSQHLVLEIDLPTFERWARAALSRQKIITDYAIVAIEEAATRDLNENGTLYLRAAEDSETSADPPPGKARSVLYAKRGAKSPAPSKEKTA